jgi:hypothetical protein
MDNTYLTVEAQALLQDVAEKSKWLDMYSSMAQRALGEAADAISIAQLAQKQYGNDHPIACHLIEKAAAAHAVTLATRDTMRQALASYEAAYAAWQAYLTIELAKAQASL